MAGGINMSQRRRIIHPHAAGGGGSIPNEGTAPSSTNFRDWAEMPVDHWYKAPIGTVLVASRNGIDTPLQQDDRTYDYDINHPNTGGIFAGMTVIVAEAPGQCYLDLSYPGKTITGSLKANGDLGFKYVSGHRAGVALVGFAIRYGQLQLNSPGVFMYQCGHTFPAANWTGEPGFSTVTNYHHWANRGILFHQHASNIRCYNADFDEISTCLAFFENGPNDIIVQGAKLTNLDNGGYYGNSGGDHGSHPDFIGDGDGGVSNMQVLDCDINPGKRRAGNGGMIMGGGFVGDSTGMVYRRLYLHNMTGQGMSCGVDRTSRSGAQYHAEGQDVYINDCDDGEFNYWVDGSITIYNDPGNNGIAAATYKEYNGSGGTLPVTSTHLNVAPPTPYMQNYRDANPYSNWAHVLFGV